MLPSNKSYSKYNYRIPQEQKNVEIRLIISILNHNFRSRILGFVQGHRTWWELPFRSVLSKNLVRKFYENPKILMFGLFWACLISLIQIGLHIVNPHLHPFLKDGREAPENDLEGRDVIFYINEWGWEKVGDLLQGHRTLWKLPFRSSRKIIEKILEKS